MTSITFTGIRTSFGETLANDIPALTIPPGEIVCFVGPSGCGKTTALRTIAGLVMQDSGDIAFGDRVVNDVPPEARNAAMVFQNYALFPHMTVAQNVGFGLSVRGRPAGEIAAKVAEMLEVVQLPQVGERYPRQLSGGQQQRIAVARALATEPDILLFDEPLSNLDAKLREGLRFELRQLLERLGVTTVYVTHDQTEAMVIGDRMLVMNGGRIVQDGRPAEVYRRPVNRFVADFLGASDVIAGTATAPMGERQAVVTPEGLRIEGLGSLAEGAPALACLRPSGVEIAPAGTAGLPAVEILSATDLGDRSEVLLAVGRHRIRAQSGARAGLAAGQQAAMRIDPERCIIVGDEP
ncbi:MAG: ABC transporter ATP-binding protein [Pseudomonadota bacterium]